MNKLLLALLLTSPLAWGEVPDSDPIDDKPVLEAPEGPRCVSLRHIRSTRVLDGETILFEMRGGTDYVNRLPRRCPGLGFHKSFGYRTGINQVCDLDVITVLESGRRGATCGLGKFEIYIKEPKGGDSEEEPSEPSE